MSTLRKMSEDRTRFERLSRNSTGAKESEFSGPRTDISEVVEKLSPEAQAAKDKMLTIVFIAMVFVGLGNKVFNKLMTVRSFYCIESKIYFIHINISQYRFLCIIIQTF